MDRDFKGVWIPREVWLDDRLSALDKMILTEIDSLDCGDKRCFASNKYIAEFCQCSERKVQDSIAKLKKLDYIKVIAFDGRTRTLASCIAEIALQTRKKCVAETKNLRHIKIDNKIDNNIIGNFSGNSKEFDNVQIEEFVPGILDKQIIKCGQELDFVEESDYIYLKDIIRRYYSAFKCNFGTAHKNISNRSMKTVIEAIMSFDGIADWRDINIWQALIDVHFETKYKNCDYSICHFASYEVLKNRLYEIS